MSSGNTHTTAAKPARPPELVCIGCDHGTKSAGFAVWTATGLRWSMQVALRPTGPGVVNLGLRLGDLAGHLGVAVTAAQAVALSTQATIVVAVEKPVGYTGRRHVGKAPKGPLADPLWALQQAAAAEEGGSQGRGTGVVGAGYGVLVMTAARQGLEVLGIYPATAKAALNPGRGNIATKADMVAAASKMITNHVPGEDEADAVGLAMAGYNAAWPALVERAAQDNGQAVDHKFVGKANFVVKAKGAR